MKKKLPKAQLGKAIKAAVKTGAKHLENIAPDATKIITKSAKPVFKKGSGALAAGTAGLLGGVGYAKYKIDRGSVKTKSDTTAVKKKMGGLTKAKKK